MGTRALVHFKEADKDSATIVTMYRQYDGYPSGLGNDIYNSLLNGECDIINGHQNQTPPQAFNGMACLAAWLIGELKDGRIGNVYLYPPDSEDCGEEYVYTIFYDGEDVRLSIFSVWDSVVLGEGKLKDFICDDSEPFGPQAPQDTVYDVQSETDFRRMYKVTHHVEKWTCTCKDHIFRKHDCKHITEAKNR